MIVLIRKRVFWLARNGVKLVQQGERPARKADVVAGRVGIDGQLAALNALPGNDPLALL